MFSNGSTTSLTESAGGAAPREENTQKAGNATSSAAALMDRTALRVRPARAGGVVAGAGAATLAASIGASGRPPVCMGGSTGARKR